MNFDWIRESKVNKIIKQLNFHRNIQYEYKALSPTVHFLKDTQIVRKTKEFYENDSAVEPITANQWKFEKQTFDIFLTKQGKSQEKVENSFKADLIAYEKDHLKKLELISRVFTKVINHSGHVSMMLRNHHISLSGCLSDIIDLHKYKILPNFQRKEVLCFDILHYMQQLIESSSFYDYVTHTMLYNSTLEWLDNYKFILDKAFSKFGIEFNKLELENIIKLYKDWTADLSSRLFVNSRENADEIALCMDVEKKLAHLLNMIADARKIACIKEVSKNNITAIEKLYHILEKKRAIKYPMLVLFPRYDCHYGYRSPFDILQLGQFVRMWNENSMISGSSKCCYNTNLFIFELCVIYTIIINENSYLYNGHFWIKDCYFESVLKDDKAAVLAVLCSGDRQLILDNSDLVNALMRLHAEHKLDEIEGELDIPFEKHIQILSKIEASSFRRVSMADFR